MSSDTHAPTAAAPTRKARWTRHLQWLLPLVVVTATLGWRLTLLPQGNEAPSSAEPAAKQDAPTAPASEPSGRASMADGTPMTDAGHRADAVAVRLAQRLMRGNLDSIAADFDALSVPSAMLAGCAARLLGLPAFPDRRLSPDAPAWRVEYLGEQGRVQCVVRLEPDHDSWILRAAVPRMTGIAETDGARAD